MSPPAPHISHRRVRRIGPRLEYLCRTTDLRPRTLGGRSDPGRPVEPRAPARAPAAVPARAPAGDPLQVRARRVRDALGLGRRRRAPRLPANHAATTTDRGATVRVPMVRVPPAATNLADTTAMAGVPPPDRPPDPEVLDAIRAPFRRRRVIVRVGTTLVGLDPPPGVPNPAVARVGLATECRHGGSSRSALRRRSVRWR